MISLMPSFFNVTPNMPQVIWANGVIASAAVGIVVDIITGWTKTFPNVIYLQYDGNSNTLMPHKRIEYMDLSANCPHYPIENVGDPMFKKNIIYF